MELSSCPDCHDLAESLRHHVKLVREAQKYMTDAHAGEVRNITPLQALQEQAVYYENMMESQDDEINELEHRLEKLMSYHMQILKYKEMIEERLLKMKEILENKEFFLCQDTAPEKCYWVEQLYEVAKFI
jgi:succinate dehydrogenase/fumarate reductase flavoprotein subunit